MRQRLLIVVAIVGLLSLPALAGNIVLTGHDDDFHENFGAGPGPAGPAGMQLSAMAVFARSGSTMPTLPVLSFDSPGGELDRALTAIGVAHTNIDPFTASNVTDALFDPTVYSAMAVASDLTCGGCDLTVSAEANISAHAAAIG